MKVVHIHRLGCSGGAGGAISMRRLHFSLRKAGIDSKILCVRETPESSHIKASKPSKIENILNYRTQKFTSRLGLEDVLNVNFRRIKREQIYQEADIINFHRIPDVFSYLAVPSLTKNKPAVFTLHEMWSFTGHCRYSLDCQRWKIGCGKCPYLHLPPAIQRDGTRFQWKLKAWAYNRSNLTIVAPSNWMFDLAKQSMLNRFPINHIAHGIDTDVYRPLDPGEARSVLNIPSDKKILMFAAQRFDRVRLLKGTDLLLKVLQILPKSLKAETVLLLLGEKGEDLADAVGMKTVNLGYVSDDHTKAMAYSVADLFLFPTRAETFGLVALESIACGTPVVSFRVGGVPDLVRPGITGYLAGPEDVTDFRDGVVQLLNDEPLRHYMGEQCRTVTLEEYPHELTTQRYIDVYQRLLRQNRIHNITNIISNFRKQSDN